jgi:hypothetical protein
MSNRARWRMAGDGRLHPLSHDATKPPPVQEEKFQTADYGEARRTRTVGHAKPFSCMQHLTFEGSFARKMRRWLYLSYSRHASDRRSTLSVTL